MFEKRKAVIFDIPVVFLQAKMSNKDHRMLLKMRGSMMDLMCEANPEFKKTMIYEKEQKVLYMYIVCSIYGFIEAALLWYNLYSEILVEMEF